LAGYNNIVKLLLEVRDIKLDIIDTEDKTALIYAIEKGYAKIVDQLIEAGVDFDLKFPDNKSALSKALSLEKIEISKQLIKNGAYLNINVDIPSGYKNGKEYIAEKSAAEPEWKEVLSLLPNMDNINKALKDAEHEHEHKDKKAFLRGNDLLEIVSNLSCLEKDSPAFKEVQVTAQETFFGKLKLVSKTGAGAGSKTHAIKTSLASKDLYENTALHIAASIGAELLVANILCSFRSGGPEGTILQQISRVNKGKKTAENLASDRGEVKIAELLHSIANQVGDKGELDPWFIESQCAPILDDRGSSLGGEVGYAAAASAEA
jgi:ankyrin repeat protein